MNNENLCFYKELFVENEKISMCASEKSVSKYGRMEAVGGRTWKIAHNEMLNIWTSWKKKLDLSHNFHLAFSVHFVVFFNIFCKIVNFSLVLISAASERRSFIYYTSRLTSIASLLLFFCSRCWKDENVIKRLNIVAL